MTTTFAPTLDLARKLIAEQFPEYASLAITDVEKQGHDNRTYRLGDHMLIRMPTAEDYALKVPKEQELLPQLAKYLSVSIPNGKAIDRLSLSIFYIQMVAREKYQFAHLSRTR
jgi:aminoglycoside phosphotransferase (APT) family kinase protein